MLTLIHGPSLTHHVHPGGVHRPATAASMTLTAAQKMMTPANSTASFARWRWSRVGMALDHARIEHVKINRFPRLQSVRVLMPDHWHVPKPSYV